MRFLIKPLVCLWTISQCLFANSDIKSKDLTSSQDWILSADVKAEMINNEGVNIGQVYAKQGTQGVVLRLKLHNLPEGIHGMHFHNIGNCEDNKHFKSAGAHINISHKPHGFLNENGPHEGNLPNLIIPKNGQVHLELYTQMVSIISDSFSLLDANGSSLVIHANQDDHITQPIGNAGMRIACGVFQKIKK